MFFNVYSYTGPWLGEGVGAYQRQFTVRRYVEVTLVLRYHLEKKCSETRNLKRVKQDYKKTEQEK